MHKKKQQKNLIDAIRQIVKEEISVIDKKFTKIFDEIIESNKRIVRKVECLENTVKMSLRGSEVTEAI